MGTGPCSSSTPPGSAFGVPGTCQWAPALSTMSSMSPESFVSSVVRVHLCARVCVRGGTGVLSRLRAVWADEGWPVFTLSVFLLVFFLFPPHPHRTLPSTQTLISQISEKVGPFHFLFIYSSPVDGMFPSVGTSGLGQLPQTHSSCACPPVGSDCHWVGRQAGPGMPCMFSAA